MGAGMLTKSEYKKLREKIDAHRAWLKGRNHYKPEELPEGLHVTNEQRTQVELYEWHNDPPERYFCYVDKVARNGYRPRITTWTGETLGYVRLGSPYRSNFGDRRRSITASGTNGKRYYGTFYEGAGDYCGLKAYKGQE